SIDDTGDAGIERRLFGEWAEALRNSLAYVVDVVQRCAAGTGGREASMEDRQFEVLVNHARKTIEWLKRSRSLSEAGSFEQGQGEGTQSEKAKALTAGKRWHG